ncbi:MULTISPECIES: LamG domain-containing protein [unclassified Streptomyces]|uniref:LamG domain-containing protein n=1 Tax=unclassified Streptomyces TaxID=2593676 RepID=UPI000DDA48F9|nr:MULTISPECIES: LamG domain-containing protein [unclassified Streptomyces]QZZ27538.1 LamG domain-containing protein [Streptomyces sp. ST1015]
MRRTARARNGGLAGLMALTVLVTVPALGRVATAAEGSDPAVTAAAAGEAPTEELAAAAAKLSGEPVEVTRLRHERREVFANADGTFTANEYAQPVHTTRGGTWVPVDDTLAQRSDGGWSPKAATVDLEFSDGGQGPFARMNRAGREYALSWPGTALPKPVIEGDTARYPEVLPGVDLTARADAEGFSHYLVVKTAEAAANPDLEAIEFVLSTKGLTVTEATDGSLKAVDSAVGGTVFESGRAVMWESADAPATVTGFRAAQAAEPPLDQADGGRTAPVGLDVAHGKLTLTPDLGLLRGDDTTYPVVIDPTPRTTGATAWSSVMSGMPNEQDWKYSGPAGMGKCPVNYNPTQCEGIGVRRLLFSFPMSFYTGKKIVSTSLSARVGAVYWADAKAEPVDLYRLGGKNYAVTSASNWSNTKDDWADHLMTVDQKISPTTCGSPANLHFSNGALLTQAQAAADGAWSTLSLGLRAKDESSYDGWKRVCGNSYLSITYNTPPTRIATSLMSTNPGGKCVTDEAKAPFIDSLPQLRTEARDADHSASYTDQVKTQFQVFYKDVAGVERSYLTETGYKSPNAGTVFSHQVVQPALGSGVGMWEPPTRTFHLRNAANAGSPDTKPVPTEPGTVPLTGDWNGDGVDTIGLYDPATRTFHLRDDNSKPANHVLVFGSAGDIPVAGDWDGDGMDTIGVWRPSTHFFYLNNELTNATADISFVYGADGMIPLAGDWNGDGYDTIGMRDPATIMIYLRNANSGGGNHHQIRYGGVGDKPVVGDWNKDRTDTVGLWGPSTHTFYLNNQNTDNVADLTFVYGADGMLPLSGNWHLDSGIPAVTTISYQARAFDGEHWGPWSSSSGVGRCYVKRDAATPRAPSVTGTPYTDDEVWRSGVGKAGTFTFDAVDTDVVGYKYAFDDEAQQTVTTTAGQPKSVTWTPTSQGLHSLTASAYDASGRTSAPQRYDVKVVDDGPVGQWNLGDLADSTEAQEELGRHPATAGPGVAFGAPGPGLKSGETVPDHAAKLDGSADAYLTVKAAEDDDNPLKRSAVVDTTQSFSVSAWVKPAALDRDMAVLSQDSADDAGLFLGYDAAKKAWAFEAPGVASGTTTRWRVQSTVTPVADAWVHLTAVYDANASGGPKMSIRVGKETAVTAARASTRAGGGDFQIGRKLTGRADGKPVYGANFQGVLADIRAYTRAVTPAESDAFQTYRPERKAYWWFEDLSADGSVPNVQTGAESLALHGPTLYRMAGFEDPQALSGEGHLQLDGVDDWAGTGTPVVAANGSYTVSVRAMLTSAGATKSQTVLSLPGRNTDRLVVRYDAGTRRWQAVVTASDTAGAATTVVTHTDEVPVTDLPGTHIAVVYDAITRQLRLYVDGVNLLEDVRLDKAPWPSAGGLQVGRAAKGEYFAGAVDEVRVYAGALDLTGIHSINNLQRDEST